MKPPSFDYEAPATLDEAVALLAANEFEAKLLAGEFERVAIPLEAAIR